MPLQQAWLSGRVSFTPLLFTHLPSSLLPSFPIQFRGGRLRGGEFTVGDGSAAIALKSFDGDILLIRPGERVPDWDDE